MKEGKALIRYFCCPCKPTKSNGHRTRNLPEHAPEKWETFKKYCGRDVDSEGAIRNILLRYEPSDIEHRFWCLDARINENGIPFDPTLAQQAVAMDEQNKAALIEEATLLTGMENPNSVAQIKQWLQEQEDIEVPSLNKKAVADVVAQLTQENTRKFMALRKEIAKSSVKKYDAMLRSAGPDDHIRGCFQFYGANRTGRFAGRLVQLQNLPQNHMPDLAAARSLVRAGDAETVNLLYDSTSNTLSELIRTALVPEPGHRFIVSDFSAIEARVIAWISGEQWRLDVFENGGDIYCASASQMFKVPVEKHGQNAHLRQKGKVAELALGYGGGVNALIAFGADKMGLTEEEMQDIVTQWRQASPTIPRFWRDTENAAKRALENPGKVFTIPCGVKYRRDRDALRCKLPSGRVLTYWGARLDKDGSICFMGQNQSTRKWEKTETWGGKLVENIVQAVARDCLAVALLRLDAAGYSITFHVHDEIIAEAPEGSRWEDMAEIMGQPIDWAPGLLLRGDGYSTPFYMKD